MSNRLRDIFRGYYRLQANELRELWLNCVFILDANVLLDLHRYPLKPRDELLALFKKVQPRIWVPFQVALEYESNRPNVIHEQVRRFQDVRKIVSESQANLEKKIGDMQLHRRHSLLNPSKFLTAIEKLSNSFIKEIDELYRRHPADFMIDPIRDQIGEILEGRVGAAPESQTALELIQKEAETRYKRKEPPGYMDGDGTKTGQLIHNGLLYQTQFGDYILWRQILDHISTAPTKQIIYITNDEKEDWWKTVGGQKLGPRPELTDEIYRVAGATHFHMYHTLQFLEQAERHLGTKVSKESIRQVRDISEAKRRGLPPLERAEFMAALAMFDKQFRDRREWQDFDKRHTYKYAIEHEGRLYPVKQVISLATGIPNYEFSGGASANRRVEELGFAVRRLSDQEEESAPLPPDEISD